MIRPAPPRIAIVGMACIFPGAGDLSTYRRNLRSGLDAITDVPASRWEPVFYDPASSALDRLYCRRGGFIDDFALFDPLRWGLMPTAAAGSEPDQLLALETAAGALADAGYADRPFARDRTGVILGRGGYLNPGMTRLMQAVRGGEELVASVAALLPDLPGEQLDAIKREYQARVGRLGPDTVIGLTPNLAASRIASRLDLKGPAYTVDAACASSLIAVDQACAELLAGRCDLMLAGGVHLTHDVAFWSVFTQLGALSRSDRIRPFHKDADGLLIGEGVGVVVLKRLAEAERDGDRIYAVIRGTGVSSDGRESSVMVPRVESQVLALHRAWEAAGLDPAAPGAVGLIEAHGTATPAGDAAELETLQRVFGPARSGEPRAGLGSVKSMIGHTMPAAGVAGLIKAALAVHEGWLPPTLHAEDPHPGVAATGFRLLAEAEPWETARGPRRAGVNAFGFGGINAHAVLEQHAWAEPRRGGRREPGRGRTAQQTGAAGDLPGGILCAAAAIPAALGEALAAAAAGRAAESEDGPCRVALLDPTPELLARAQQVIAHGQPFHDRAARLWFSPRGLLTDGGQLAVLFPGVESSFAPRVDDLAAWLGEMAPASAPADLEQAGVAILAANRLLYDALSRIGLEPAYVAGHSIGEWSAMRASGVIPPAALDALVATLAPGTLEVSSAVFAAIGCGVERTRDALQGLEGVHVSHDNCPHQTIICGAAEAVESAVARLRAKSVLCQVLPFRSGFHSPLFAPFRAALQPLIDGLAIGPATSALWSATTCGPFPESPEAARRLIGDHLVRPVRFRELIEGLYAAGARVFVQAGTGSLPAFIDDTLRGRPYLAVPANVPRRSGLDQLRRLAAAVWVEGGPVAWANVPAPAPGVAHRKVPPMRLILGAPIVSVATPLGPAFTRSNGASAAALAASTDPVLAAYAATLSALEQSRDAVVAAWRTRSAAAPSAAAPRTVRFTRELSLATCPELIDHSFFSLPPGWPHPEDGFPLVPLAMSLMMIMDAARRLLPDRVVTGLESVRAFRWMVVERPLTLSIEATWDGADRVRVTLGDYVEGTAVVATAYPPAPLAATAPLADEAPVPSTPAAVYRTRLMFHGPAYHAMTAFTGMSRAGIRGQLASLPAEGALLDGAAQLIGYWIKLHADSDRLGVPVMLQRASFYGPHPPAGQRLDCTVHIRRPGARQVSADVEFSAGGRVWARFQGWEERRTPSAAWMWPVIQFPDRNALATPVAGLDGGAWLPADLFPVVSSRDYFARRYLDGREMAAYRALGPRRRAEWLAGRIAVKDAVRQWLWARGHGPLFPIQVAVHAEPGRRPRVTAPDAPDLRVSLSHRAGAAAARVAEGHEVGIDLERVEPRAPGFDAIAFTAAERALLPLDDRDAWRARFWAAKEAVAKRAGTGLAGNPGRFPVDAVDGDELRVAGVRVTTRRDGELVFAWTEEQPDG
ncbi:MAG: beta-ketoacyl synthase N-terminal-like domain-containing protein [Gemmatimonadota bacterium]